MRLSSTFPSPLGVILNTVPCKALPPFSVVPTKSPAWSRIKPEKEFQPVLASTKLYKVLSVHVPFALGVSSNTVPQKPAPFVSPQVDDLPTPPMNVVPQRLPALSNASPPVGLWPSVPLPVKRWRTVSVHFPFARCNLYVVPQPLLQKRLVNPPPPLKVPPKRSPAWSKIKRPLGLHPSFPLRSNLCRMVSFHFPLLVSDSSKTIPQPLPPFGVTP